MCQIYLAVQKYKTANWGLYSAYSVSELKIDGSVLVVPRIASVMSLNGMNI